MPRHHYTCIYYMHIVWVVNGTLVRRPHDHVSRPPLHLLSIHSPIFCAFPRFTKSLFSSPHRPIVRPPTLS